MQVFGLHDSNKNPVMITPWIFMHFVVGVVVTRFIPDKGIGFSLHTIYEIIDYIKYNNFYKGDPGEPGWYNNSVANSIGDTIGFVIGQFVSEYIGLSNTMVVILYFLFFYLFTQTKLG